MMKLINTGTLQEVKDIFIRYSDGEVSNVRYLANGFTSTVFQSGDKIIKIGKKRIKFDGQFSKYALQPYLRKEFRDLEGNVIFTAEVQDRCKTSDIDKDKIKAFMERINEDSEEFAWLDSGEENVFELLKDNERKISEEEDGFSYEGVLDTQPLGKAGDLVIGDTDFLYSPEEARDREDSYKTPNHTKTFSLILPTYNMKNYLAKCLNSILNQTCDDYEVLKELAKIYNLTTKELFFDMTALMFYDFYPDVNIYPELYAALLSKRDELSTITDNSLTYDERKEKECCDRILLKYNM